MKKITYFLTSMETYVCRIILLSGYFILWVIGFFENISLSNILLSLIFAFLIGSVVSSFIVILADIFSCQKNYDTISSILRNDLNKSKLLDLVNIANEKGTISKDIANICAFILYSEPYYRNIWCRQYDDSFYDANFENNKKAREKFLNDIIDYIKHLQNQDEETRNSVD